MQTNLLKKHCNFRAKAIVFALLFCLFASQIVVGQAAIELSKLSPEQRQGLIDELVNKGYTGLRDLPVAEAAERAGEIVGTLAMEAVLAKGAGISLKGLSALKGTAFVTRIETLAQTAKQTIAEVKVPMRATVEAAAELNGGVRPVIVTEKKTIGELLQTMEARAKEILSGGTENASRVKSIGLPSWNKLTIRMEADGVPTLNKQSQSRWMAMKQILNVLSFDRRKK